MKIGDSHPDWPGWYFDIVPLYGGRARIVVTDGYSCHGEVW